MGHAPQVIEAEMRHLEAKLNSGWRPTTDDEFDQFDDLVTDATSTPGEGQLALAALNLAIHHDVPLVIQTFHRVLFRLGQSGRSDDAADVIEQLLTRGKVDAKCLNMLMMSHANADRAEDAEAVLKLFVQQNLLPDSFSFRILIGGWGRRREWKGVLRVFSVFKRTNLVPTTEIYSALLHAANNCENYPMALEIFTAMEVAEVEPDEHVVRNYLKALANTGGTSKQAFDFVRRIRTNGFEVNEAVYFRLLEVLASAGDVHEAWNVIDEMFTERVEPNRSHYICLLNACNVAGATAQCRQVVDQMVGQGLDIGQNPKVMNAVLKAYVDNHEHEAAVDFFEWMAQTHDCAADGQSHYHLMRAYVSLGRKAETFGTLQAMRDAEVPLRPVHYRLLLRACGLQRWEAEARRLIRELRTEGVELDRDLKEALMYYHACLNDVRACEEVLASMKTAEAMPPTSAYVEMIRAYGLSRQLDRAFDTLKQMRLEHVSRSTGVYEALVGACEHFGASVAMVMQVHQAMKTDGGLMRLAGDHARYFDALVCAVMKKGLRGGGSGGSGSGSGGAAMDMSVLWDGTLDVLAELEALERAPSARLCERLVQAFRQGGRWKETLAVHRAVQRHQLRVAEPTWQAMRDAALHVDKSARASQIERARRGAPSAGKGGRGASASGVAGPSDGSERLGAAASCPASASSSDDEFAGLTATTDLRTKKLNARQKDYVRQLRRKGGKGKRSKRPAAAASDYVPLPASASAAIGK